MVPDSWQLEAKLIDLKVPMKGRKCQASQTRELVYLKKEEKQKKKKSQSFQEVHKSGAWGGIFYPRSMNLQKYHKEGSFLKKPFLNLKVDHRILDFS